MRLLGLDFESTGFDTSKERITEIGAALWDTETKRPLVTVGVFYWDDSYPKQSEEVIRVTGITDDMLREFGTPSKANLAWLDNFARRHGVGYVVAHNGTNFDRPLLMAELDRQELEAPTLRTLPWLDTLTDIPFATEPDSRKLKHLAGEHGFLNPFAHRAVFDVLTMLKVLANYDIEKVIEYSQIPWVIVAAQVSFADKDLAKARRYSWEKIGDRTFPKQWIKRMKKNQLEKEQQEAPFKLRILEGS